MTKMEQTFMLIVRKKPSTMLFVPISTPSIGTCIYKDLHHLSQISFMDYWYLCHVFWEGAVFFVSSEQWIRQEILQSLFLTMLEIIGYIFVIVVSSSSDTFKHNCTSVLFIEPTNFELCITTCSNKK